MGLLNLLTFFLLIIAGCQAEAPEIQLMYKKVTMNEGDNYQVMCKGNEAMQWRFPNRHENCYNADTANIRNRTTERNGTLNSFGYRYYSTLTITNISYLDVGYVECFYPSTNELDKFYLFVNSSEHLMLPCLKPPRSANVKCALPGDTISRSTYTMLPNYNSFAPCKPTSELVTMEVQRKTTNEKMETNWDFYQGFQLLNVSFREDKVVCIATSKQNSTIQEHCLMSIQYQSQEHYCDVSLKSSNNANVVLTNSDLTLTCSARCLSRPIGYNVSVSHGGIELPVSDSFWQPSGQFWDFQAEISLVNVSKQQDGLYSCLLTTPKYNTSRDLTILIKEKMAPIFFHPDADVEFTLTPSENNETETIVLDCLAIGMPLPEYSWSHNGYYLHEASGMGELTVSPSSDSDFACSVNNSIGLPITREFRIRKSASENARVVDARQIASWVIACIALGVLAVIVAGFLFIFHRLRHSNRRAKLKALMEQIFSENGFGPLHEDETSTEITIERPDILRMRSVSPLSRPESEQTTSTTVRDSTATSGIEDQIENSPYKKEVFEINVKHLQKWKLIGRGAFGVVYKAEYSYLDETGSAQAMPVAVKCIRDSYDLEQYASLSTEIKLLSMLGRHLNVVGLVGAVTNRLPDGVLYMVLEFCAGGSLYDFLKQHRERFFQTEEFDYFSLKKHNSLSSPTESEYVMPNANGFANDRSPSTPSATSNSTYLLVESDVETTSRQPLLSSGLPTDSNGYAIRYSSSYSQCEDVIREKLSTRDLIIFSHQIASGMAFLHERQCLHRDLAARNVLVCNGNILKITDFGLAKDLTKYGAQYQKKHDRKLPYKWMAPECVRDGCFSRETDVWSFGVLMWEIFTLGQVPYPEITSYSHSFIKMLDDGYRLPRPDFVTDEMANLILACWHSVPKKRPDFVYLKAAIGQRLSSNIVYYYSSLEAATYSTHPTPTRASSSAQVIRGYANLPGIPEESAKIMPTNADPNC